MRSRRFSTLIMKDVCLKCHISHLRHTSQQTMLNWSIPKDLVWLVPWPLMDKATREEVLQRERRRTITPGPSLLDPVTSSTKSISEHSPPQTSVLKSLSPQAMARLMPFLRTRQLSRMVPTTNIVKPPSSRRREFSLIRGSRLEALLTHLCPCNSRGSQRRKKSSFRERMMPSRKYSPSAW